MHRKGTKIPQIQHTMKATLPILLAAASGRHDGVGFFLRRSRRGVHSGFAGRKREGRGGGTKTENNTTVVNPAPSAPSKTETNTSTTVSPGGVQQSTTTETK
jgi:hypothetical protein